MLRKSLDLTRLQQWSALYLIVFMVFGFVLVDGALAFDRKVLFEDFTATT